MDVPALEAVIEAREDWEVTRKITRLELQL